MKSIRFLALLLCAALLLPLVPVHAAQSGGSFYLTASTAGQTLIEPVAVPYAAGQTIRDALRGSGYASAASIPRSSRTSRASRETLRSIMTAARIRSMRLPARRP